MKWFETACDLKVFVFARGRYEFLEIQLVTAATLPLVVFRKENGRDRLGRKIFLNRELQFGEASFDDAVYIESDERDEHIRAALSDKAMRDAIVHTVQEGLPVTFSKHGVSLTLSISLAGVPLEEINKRISALKDLAKGIQSVEGAAGTYRKNRGDVLAVASWWLFASVYLGGLLGGIFRPSLWEPMSAEGHSLTTTLAIVLPLACIIGGFVYLRGHSRSLRNFALFVLPALFWSPVAPSVVLWPLNAAVDSAPVSTMTGRVVGHYSKKDGKRTN